MTIRKNINGYWIISDIIKGHRIIKKYLFYTKKQAIRLFKKDTKKV